MPKTPGFYRTVLAIGQMPPADYCTDPPYDYPGNMTLKCNPEDVPYLNVECDMTAGYFWGSDVKTFYFSTMHSYVVQENKEDVEATT